MKKILVGVFVIALFAVPALGMTLEGLQGYAKSFMAFHLAKESAKDLDSDVIFGAIAFKAYVDGVNDASPVQFDFPATVTIQEVGEVAAVFILYSKDKYEQSSPPAAVVWLALSDKYGVVDK
jgi:hypothetical protein